MLKQYIFPIFLLFNTALFTSCEDVIDINTDPAPQLLVIDAWINNLDQPQVISLGLSQPYFNNSAPEGIIGADVIVQNSSGKTLIFEDQNNGNYVWMPTNGETIGTVGDEFILQIEWNGQSYEATSLMNRVPEIDSITQELREPELGNPAGIFANFFARDLPGPGDAYWIKTYKNGQFLNKPIEMNLAFDAAFDSGSSIDGVVFIVPIRELINRIPDPDTDDNIDVPPYMPGDSIQVEIHSITEEAFNFLNIAKEQMTNGDNTIFALPLANTKSNVLNTASGERALGFFNVSKVATKGKMME